MNNKKIIINNEQLTMNKKNSSHADVSRIMLHLAQYNLAQLNRIVYLNLSKTFLNTYNIIKEYKNKKY